MRTTTRSGRGVVREWVDERVPFLDDVDAKLSRRVPNYSAAAYRYLGGVAVMLIVIEFITGFLLGIYYVPDGAGNPAAAYTSTVYIQNTAYLGWLVRGIHFWGANLLLVVALLHMTFVFWNGGYRAPRELNWMVGVLVFLVIVLFTFTGSLLPWDANSYLGRLRAPGRREWLHQILDPGRPACRARDPVAVFHGARVPTSRGDEPSPL